MKFSNFELHFGLHHFERQLYLKFSHTPTKSVYPHTMIHFGSPIPYTEVIGTFEWRNCSAWNRVSYTWVWKTNPKSDQNKKSKSYTNVTMPKDFQEFHSQALRMGILTNVRTVQTPLHFFWLFCYRNLLFRYRNKCSFPWSYLRD